MRLPATPYIWSPFSYHTEADRNYRALLLWDTLHQSPVLLPVLPGNQKCKALTILSPGYLSEFHSQPTISTGGMRSLFWKKTKFTCCRVRKQWIPPKLRVAQQRNTIPCVCNPIWTLRSTPVGRGDKEGLDTSKLMFGLFGMPPSEAQEPLVLHHHRANSNSLTLSFR